MKYMLLICSSETEEDKLSEAELGQLLQAYGGFHEEIAAAGVLLGGDRLKPTTQATTVRVRGGQTKATDGPFAETKEAIGGYYMIDVKNLDEAIAWAAKIPSAAHGSIEVRPIWEPEEY